MYEWIIWEDVTKAHFTQQIIANSVSEIFEFLEKYELTDWKILTDSKILLIGESKSDFEDDIITKPAQFEVFVLSYSRRIMLHYNKILSPNLTEFLTSYTDTDSMHIFATEYFKLKDLGLIRNAEIGYLSNDIEKDGFIFYEKYLGPKWYIYTFFNNENNIGITMKTKGIKKSALLQEFYKDEKGIVNFYSLKKVRFNVTKKELDKGIEMLNIYHDNNTRTFNKSSWNGRELINNIYYPFNYIIENTDN